jgi:hypothetical protein
MLASGRAPGSSRDLVRVISPTDPRWEPDPTGQRLAMIKASRRGALFATILFAPVVLVAVAVVPPEGFGTPQGTGVGAVLLSLPALALLGAALTPAVLGSRWSAASAGLAMGVGVPVAAVASAMIGVYLVVAFLKGPEAAGEMAGLVLRDGVTTAARVAPLIAAASIVWVASVRRWARPTG